MLRGFINLRQKRYVNMKKTKYDKLTSKYQKPLMKSLEEFVAIDSSYDESTVNETNPFGGGVSDALNYITNLARKDGFEVTNYDNKIVEILYGRGPKNLTIMAHADVVPAGDGWIDPPFKMTERKGMLYGRGVSDDKGPLLATYYALKALRDEGELGGYEIRFLVGGNEESGSLCMEHYFGVLKKKQPTLGFSPDSDFPLIYAEKGIVNFKVTVKVEVPGLISIKGGTARNAVIDKCELKHDLDLNFLKYIMEHYHRTEAAILTKDDVTTVTFFGKAAHGSTPEKGINAGMMALKSIAEFSKNETLLKLVKLYEPLDAKGYNCDAKNEEMGTNSSNVGIISYKDGILELYVNFRYINKCDPKELLANIKEANKGFEVKVEGQDPVLFFPQDHELVQALLKCYQDETGDLVSKPLAIGGGTYAKCADNVVAFGMQFPGFDSLMHSPGEMTKKEDLFKAMSIYAHAIYELGEILKK